MKSKQIILLFAIISMLCTTSLNAQDDYKSINTIGLYYSEIDDAFGEYICEASGNDFWYCFNGEENGYPTVSTKIFFSFKNAKVTSCMYIWEHYTYSKAIEDVNWERDRLKGIYGRPEIKNGQYHFFTNKGHIMCSYNFQNGEHQTVLFFTET